MWITVRKYIAQAIKNEPYELLFFGVFMASFLLLITNLNYNTAFNDEAIYIVVGRMGLYTSDWFSYGANQWMAGLPYIYPTLTTLAYETTGLLGARFLNVIFGLMLIEEVFRFTRLLRIFDDTTNHLAAVIAAFLVGFSAIVMYVSRLATYDILSFLLLLTGVNSFIKAGSFANGKYYFISFFCLFFAFLTKIIVGIYFPVLFVLSLLILRKRPPEHKRVAMTYFYAPFLIGTLLYGYFHLQSFLTFVQTHKDEGKSENLGELVRLIAYVAGPLLVAAIPSSVLLALRGKKREMIALLALAAVIPVFHIALNRLATLDKHLTLTVVFLSPLAGYGVSLFLRSVMPKLVNAKAIRHIPGRMGAIGLRLTLVIAVCTVGLLYVIRSLAVRNDFENGWKNTEDLQEYLYQNVKPNDKVLTQEGAVVILALYDNIFPPNNIVTFDWIDYSGFTDERGYRQAIRDRYFDFIELDREHRDENSLVQAMLPDIAQHYTLVKSIGSFEIYENNNK